MKKLIIIILFAFFCTSCSESHHRLSQTSSGAILKRYIKRNKTNKHEIFIIILKKDSLKQCFLEIKTVVYLSQLIAANPHSFSKIDSINVCLSNEYNNTKHKVIIPYYIKTSLIDDTKTAFRVTENGDSILLNKIVMHDPEILRVPSECDSKIVFSQIANSLGEADAEYK